MGLRDIAESAKESSSSSSSSSGGSRYPRYDRRCPQAILIRDEDDLVFVEYPHTPAVEFKQEWWTTPYKPADHLPEHWERVWWTSDELKRHAHMVREELDEDLMELLRNDPQEGLNALVEAARNWKVEPSKGSRYRNCAICGETLYIIRDNHREISNRVVCDSHTVRDLAEHDLI